MKTKTSSFSFATYLTIYLILLIVWSIYRIFFKTNVFIEESLIKGIIFSFPLLLFPLDTNLSKYLSESLGITSRNFFKSVYLGIILGMLLGLFGQFGNFLRHGQLLFNTYGLSSGNIGAFLILALITAFFEQLLFSGYYLKTALLHTHGDEVSGITITAFLFAVIHLPAFFIVQHMSPSAALISFVLLFSLGLACNILRLRQKNLISPIMAHALWGITVFLFR